MDCMLCINVYYRLELVAVDDYGRSTKQPVAVEFAALRARLSRQRDTRAGASPNADLTYLLQPKETRALMTYIIPLLSFVQRPEGLQLVYSGAPATKRSTKSIRLNGVPHPRQNDDDADLTSETMSDGKHSIGGTDETLISVNSINDDNRMDDSHAAPLLDDTAISSISAATNVSHMNHHDHINDEEETKEAPPMTPPTPMKIAHKPIEEKQSPPAPRRVASRVVTKPPTKQAAEPKKPVAKTAAVVSTSSISPTPTTRTTKS
jgi:hypothetical protein